MSLDIRRSLLLPSIIVIGAIAAACSSSGGAATVAPSVAAPSAASVEPSSAAPSSAAPSEAASPSAAGGVSLALADSALGKIIVDGNGLTLYMFTPDDEAGGKPTCVDACAANWPALTATDAASVTAGAGLDASKISIVDRPDGTKQVKYGDYPLYHFAKDTAAGQTNGQGLATKWYVVGADGEPIKS